MKKSVKVVGAIIEREGLVFAAQRSESMSLPGVWEFPGGKIEAHETPQEALSRELAEELKVESAQVGSFVAQTVYEYDFAIVDLTTFEVNIGSQDPVLTEHSAARWLAADELKSVDWAPADVPAVDAILEKLRG